MGRLIKHARSERPGSSSEDPDKPNLPYILGFTTQIEPHEPPAPFNNDGLYGDWPRRDLSDVDLETVTQSALVVSHPPTETSSNKTPDGATPEMKHRGTAQLTVISVHRIGYDSGAQVVVCTITQAGKQPFYAVAKIFDALYYRFSHSGARRDVTAQADMDYATEAAAYKHLADAGETSASTPKYYGSWTLKLPITSRGVSQFRPVRLLLLERLEGMSLNGLRMQNSLMMHNSPDAFYLPEDYRLEILARALDSYMRLMHQGINHGALSGRNVILVTNNAKRRITATNTDISRVVLVDYKAAIVYSHTNMGKHSHEDFARPVNPMEWFWSLPLAADFDGWVPRDWENSQRLQQEWLMRRFGSEEQRARYEPVAEDMKLKSKI